MNKKNNFQTLYKYAMVVILTAFITAMCVSTFMYKENTKEDESFSFKRKLETITSIIKEDFLGEVDEEKLNDAALQAYVGALGDKYSAYIPQEKMGSYTKNLFGNYVGIGVSIKQNKEKDLIQIVSTVDEGPADKAGILVGDLILSIDGTKYTADDISTVSKIMQEGEDTSLKLQIQREDKELEFEVVRKKIMENPIYEKQLENDIGYLQISSFDEETAQDFKNKFLDLKEKGIKSLIIDLRQNGGGIVTEAIDIAEYIVNNGDSILITVNKEGEEKITKSSENPIIDMPIVVLVDNDTASASEILAGCLKDLGKAKIVGTQTYGKGVIQEFLTLKDGSGLKITSQEYYTPNKNKINKIGITPDEIVELPENAVFLDENTDTQLQKAIELLK